MVRASILRPFAGSAAFFDVARGLFAPLVILVSFAGCAPGGAIDGPGARVGGASDADEAEDSKIEANFLEFQDLEAFFETLGTLKTKDRDALESWESQRGFVSMGSIYARILEETTSGGADGPDGDGPEGSPDLGSRAGFSYSARYTGMLRPSRFGLDMNVTVDDYAKLVNKDGLVRIGDFIYQFTRDKVKATGGRGGSRVALLKQAQTTNEGLAVWVTRVVIKSSPQAAEEIAAPGSFSRSCESVAGSSRLIAYEELVEWIDPANPRRIITNYGLKLRSLRREGAWLDHWTDAMKATGWYEGSAPLGKKSYSIDIAQGATVSTLHYPFLENHQTFEPAARPVVRSSEHHVFGESGTGCAID
jgi:hypothetical protein